MKLPCVLEPHPWGRFLVVPSSRVACRAWHRRYENSAEASRGDHPGHAWRLGVCRGGLPRRVRGMSRNEAITPMGFWHGIFVTGTNMHSAKGVRRNLPIGFGAFGLGGRLEVEAYSTQFGRSGRYEIETVG